MDEKVVPQYVSGDTFDRLGITPATGRLLTPSDDLHPGDHPVAVLSHSLWMRRFGGNPRVVDRWFTMDHQSFQIIGVAAASFTGLEPGVRTDVWLPMMMGNRDALHEVGWQWFRTLGRLRPGVGPDDARAILQPVFTAVRRERLSGFRADEPRRLREQYLRTPLFVRPAANGPSTLRKSFERPLWILATVVALVLLIACSNVANLLTARAAAREREMALRLSIGAGRARLVQQLLVESALLALSASVLAVLLALAVAPIIVDMLGTSSAPAYLDLRLDWRLLAFAVAIVMATTGLFGLVPALRASGVSPLGALKAIGGRASHRARLLRPLLAAQMAFSLTVLFIAGLLTLSFARLAQIDVGFHASGLSLVNVRGNLTTLERPKQRVLIEQTLDSVRRIASVNGVSASAWALFEGSGWSSNIRINGRPVDRTEVYYLPVSPGFMATMRIPLLAGRDLAPADLNIDPATAVLVNETFVRRFFPGERAVGRDFGRTEERDRLQPQHIVGVVADAKCRELREPAPPTVYVPLESFGPFGGLELDVAGPVVFAGERPHPAAAERADWCQSGAGDRGRGRPGTPGRQHDDQRAAARASRRILCRRELDPLGGWIVRGDELLGRATHAGDWHPRRARRAVGHVTSIGPDRRLRRDGVRYIGRPRWRNPPVPLRPNDALRGDAIRYRQRLVAGSHSLLCSGGSRYPSGPPGGACRPYRGASLRVSACGRVKSSTSN